MCPSDPIIRIATDSHFKRRSSHEPNLMTSKKTASRPNVFNALGPYKVLLLPNRTYEEELKSTLLFHFEPRWCLCLSNMEQCQRCE